MREREIVNSIFVRNGDEPKADVDQVGVEVRVADDRIHSGTWRICASAEETNPSFRRRRHSAW